jgi:hypothetical protein
MVDNSMLEKLRSIIVARQKLSQNKCGTTIIFLREELNINSEEIKILVNELHAQRFIRIRQGISQKLIFLR